MYLIDMKLSGERTTTVEALLGLLSLGPMSGYQMRQLIDSSIGNFWQESYGQIYPTLKRLRAEGLVEMRDGAGRGRVESKVYALTDAGRERLGEWLRTESVPQVPRNELLLKIFFGGLVPPAVVREQVRAFRELHMGELRRFEAIETEMRTERGSDPRMPFWLITLRYGQAESRALVAWCEQTLETIGEIEAAKGQGETLPGSDAVAESVGLAKAVNMAEAAVMAAASLARLTISDSD